jgi:hemolysin activation/secretion protein
VQACFRNSLFTIVAAFFGVFVSTTALAQQGASQPSFDPRQLERRFDDDTQAPQRSDAKPRTVVPRVSSQPGAVSPPPGGRAARTLFKLAAVSVAGSAAVSRDVVAEAWQPYIGKQVTEADLAAIAAAITEKHRQAGYFLTRAIIPPQDIRDGRVRVEVIEGSIAEISLTGESAAAFGLDPLLAPITAERPARLSTLERQLLLIGDRPGVRIVDTTLDEIGKTTGRFRLVIKLRAWRVYSAWGFDNLGSSAVGPWQTWGTAAFNSYVVPGDALTFNVSSVAPEPRELGFGRVSYDAPIGTDGVRIGGSALYSDVRPGDEFRRETRNRTRTETFEARASVAPIQSQALSMVLTSAFGFSDVLQDDMYGLIYRDRIRTLTLTADFRYRDPFNGVSYLSLVGRQGLDVFGATQVDDLFASRAGASGEFSVFNAWFTRYHTFSDEWSLKVAAAGQLANQALLLSQQFYLGGSAFGRGYGAAEISGDNAFAGSVELRLDQTFNSPWLKGVQLYGFLDSGVVWNDGYHIKDGLSLTSTGVGARFFLAEDLQAGIGVAFPLTYRALDNFDRGPRLLFSLSSALRICPERPRAICS